MSSIPSSYDSRREGGRLGGYDETQEVRLEEPPTKKVEFETNLVGQFKFFYVNQEFRGKKFTAEDHEIALGLISANEKIKDHVVEGDDVNEVADKSSEAALIQMGKRARETTTATPMKYEGLSELMAFFRAMSQAATLGGGEYSAVKMLTVDPNAARYLISRNQADLQTLDAARSQYTGDTTHEGIKCCYALSKEDGEYARSIFKNNGHRVVDNQIGAGFQAEMGGVRFLFLYVDASSFKPVEDGSKQVGKPDQAKAT